MKHFFTIIFISVVGVCLGALMGTAEAVVLGNIFCIAASTTHIIQAIEKLKE